MPMLSKIEITIDFNGPEAKLYNSNTQKQNGESFSNFTKLFLLSLSTICIIIYFIQSSGYSNLKLIAEAHGEIIARKKRYCLLGL